MIIIGIGIILLVVIQTIQLIENIKFTRNQDKFTRMNSELMRAANEMHRIQVERDENRQESYFKQKEKEHEHILKAIDSGKVQIINS